MFLLGVEVQSIEVTLFGAEIRSLSKEYTGRAGQIAIFAAGGISNLISGITAALLGYSFFASCSIALAVVNLLPIRTLDGGCILELLLQDMPFRYSEKILGVVSAIFIFLLWLTAVYIILLCRGNLSLMLFCSYMFVTLYLA
jgi:Zn-dependent protease